MFVVGWYFHWWGGYICPCHYVMIFVLLLQKILCLCWLVFDMLLISLIFPQYLMLMSILDSQKNNPWDYIYMLMKDPHMLLLKFLIMAEVLRVEMCYHVLYLLQLSVLIMHKVEHMFVHLNCHYPFFWCISHEEVHIV